MKPQGAGREILLFYNILSHLAATYADVGGREIDPKRRLLWTRLSDMVLSDIGQSYDIWTLLQEELNYGVPIPQHRALVKKCEKYFKRMEQISDLVGSWALTCKFTRFFYRFEQSLGQMLLELKETHPLDQKILESMETNVKARQGVLRRLVAENAAVDRRLENLEPGFFFQTLRDTA